MSEKVFSRGSSGWQRQMMLCTRTAAENLPARGGKMLSSAPMYIDAITNGTGLATDGGERRGSNLER